MEQEIPNRRRSRSEVTPQIEDGGLFKHELQDVSVDLNPVFGRNSRGDLLIKGIARPEKEVEVVFAGRRLPDAADLHERVKQLGLARGPRARFQVSIRGNWRLRFAPDESGWGVKSYQLLAAQWAYFDDEGEPVLCGCLPVPIQNHIMDRARAAQAVQLAQAKAMAAVRDLQGQNGESAM
jgi:hypothetical protein